MKSVLNDLQKKALADILYVRIKNKITLIAKKKTTLITGLKKKSEDTQIQRLREDLLH